MPLRLLLVLNQDVEEIPELLTKVSCLGGFQTFKVTIHSTFCRSWHLIDYYYYLTLFCLFFLLQTKKFCSRYEDAVCFVTLPKFCFGRVSLNLHLWARVLNVTYEWASRSAHSFGLKYICILIWQRTGVVVLLLSCYERFVCCVLVFQQGWPRRLSLYFIWGQMTSSRKSRWTTEALEMFTCATTSPSARWCWRRCTRALFATSE